MEVKVGVLHSHKELSVHVEGDPGDVITRVNSALSEETPVLWLDDADGDRVGIPVDKIAYVEIVGTDGKSQVGFGNA
jgi:hypothetical protein